MSRLLAAVSALVLVGLLVACGARTTSSTAPAPIPREDFKKLALRKTKAEVLEALGRPDSTEDLGDGNHKSWTYRRRAHDPISGKVDRVTQLIFEDGKVVRINFL